MSSEGDDVIGRDPADSNRPQYLFVPSIFKAVSDDRKIEKRLPAASLKSLDKGKEKKATKDGWVTGACGAQKCTCARAGDQILQETFNIKRRLNSTTKADALLPLKHFLFVRAVTQAVPECTHLQRLAEVP